MNTAIPDQEFLDICPEERERERPSRRQVRKPSTVCTKEEWQNRSDLSTTFGEQHSNLWSLEGLWHNIIQLISRMSAATIPQPLQCTGHGAYTATMRERQLIASGWLPRSRCSIPLAGAPVEVLARFAINYIRRSCHRLFGNRCRDHGHHLLRPLLLQSNKRHLLNDLQSNATIPCHSDCIVATCICSLFLVDPWKIVCSWVVEVRGF